MMDDSIHILLIEDDPAHAELIKRAFEDRGDRSHLTIAHTLEEAGIQLNKFRPTSSSQTGACRMEIAVRCLPKIITRLRHLSSL